MTEQNFGYRQELNRTMGGFSSFAVSFSLISVLTGLFANFNFGFRQVGGWILWSWMLVACGQFLIAKVMARLSVRFPIAGYGYQWTSRLINPHFGFFIGWMLLAQFLTGFPGIAQTAAVTLAGVAGWSVSQQTIILLTIVIITSVTLVHLWGIRAAARVNDLGVYAELIGVVVIILFLFWAVTQTSAIQLNLVTIGENFKTGASPGFSAMALSLLLGAWGLTGFEAAADLAEETQSPQKIIPKAVINSLLGAAVAGVLILLLLILLTGDLKAAQQSSDPLMYILNDAIGPKWTAGIMIFVVISIFACAVASMATASRLLFSMARDRMLPFSFWLSKVNGRTKSPQSATIAVWVFSCLAVTIFQRIEVITSVCALASFIGYAGIMFACLKDDGKLLSVSAFIWSLLVVGALAFPETEVPGLQTRHLPAISAGVVFIAGLIVYLTFVRNRILSGKAGPPPSNHLEN